MNKQSQTNYSLEQYYFVVFLELALVILFSQNCSRESVCLYLYCIS